MAEPSLSARGQELYLDYTLRTLQRQATVLSELRTRANILLSATGVVAGLFGPPALTDKDPEEALFVAAAALGVAVLCCIVVLWPVSDKQGLGRKWRVTLNAEDILAIASGAPDEGPVGVDTKILGELAAARERNYTTINRRTQWFNLACALLPVQVGAWFAVLYF